MKKISLIAGLVVCLGYCGAASATLIERDLKSGGDSLLTFDRATKLEWLDITESSGRSFDDVSTQFDIAGDFEGFRYATRGELETFFGNAGISPLTPSTTVDLARIDAINALLTLIGINETDQFHVRSTGFIDEISNIDGTDIYRYGPQISTWNSPARSIISTGGGYVSTTTSSNIGSWLLRPVVAVPEPTTLALMTLGIAGIGYNRQRKSRDLNAGDREPA